jgi:hypothetical protein
MRIAVKVDFPSFMEKPKQLEIVTRLVNTLLFLIELKVINNKDHIDLDALSRFVRNESYK